MNIKEAERQSGVPKQNIRFYEKKGLVNPIRNQENDYREYTEEDIRVLKTIRMLRMLDMPLEEIGKVLDGSREMKAAARQQKERLKEQRERLDAAIFFCDVLQQEAEGADVDVLLRKMDEPKPNVGFYTTWLEDYKAVARAERKRKFSFEADEPVTNSKEFTAVLLKYGRENDLNLVVTREGMYPVFEIDGVEYVAERIYHKGPGYRVPGLVVRIECEMTHPEECEPDVSPERKMWIRIFLKIWPFLLAFLVFIAMRGC